MDLNTHVILVVVASALLGLWLLVAGMRRMGKKKIVSGCGEGLCGCGLLVLAVAVAAVALNLHTWNRLTNEQQIATLYFEQLTTPQEFVVTLSYPDGPMHRYALEGDEWQLDARVLKWDAKANLLGLDARYKLERLSARFRDLERERRGPRSVHDLAETAGLDIWAAAREYPQWLPWVDAVFGSAAYLPMANGAEYQVALSQSGLIARATNPAAEAALRHW